jgi:hypothetical protein
LVAATEISGPPRVSSVPSAMRVRCEPTTLQMPMIGAPASTAIFTASIVSAVSPDCDIAIVSVRGSIARSP